MLSSEFVLLILTSKELVLLSVEETRLVIPLKLVSILATLLLILTISCLLALPFIVVSKV